MRKKKMKKRIIEDLMHKLVSISEKDWIKNFIDIDIID